jgi:hypothetical protein
MKRSYFPVDPCGANHIGLSNTAWGLPSVQVLEYFRRSLSIITYSFIHMSLQEGDQHHHTLSNGILYQLSVVLCHCVIVWCLSHTNAGRGDNNVLYIFFTPTCPSRRASSSTTTSGTLHIIIPLIPLQEKLTLHQMPLQEGCSITHHQENSWPT